MRRAVSTCTSPEVVFGPVLNAQPPASQGYTAHADPLGLAMDTLQLSSPVIRPTGLTPQSTRDPEQARDGTQPAS